MGTITMGLNCVINVFLTDSEYRPSQIDDIDRWAVENCPCYHGVKSVDVSDVSYQYDTVYEFHFTSQRDVTLFKLVWM